MLELELSKQFKRDLKKVSKQGKDRDLINEIIDLLQNETTLHSRHKDHNLSGNWSGYRECHITPDWLLIYKIIKEDCVKLLRLSRTGSHSELFR